MSWAPVRNIGRRIQRVAVGLTSSPPSPARISRALRAFSDGESRQGTATKRVRLPLLPSGPGGVCKPSIRGPWRGGHHAQAWRGDKEIFCLKKWQIRLANDIVPRFKTSLIPDARSSQAARVSPLTSSDLTPPKWPAFSPSFRFWSV